jgi:hypothetical protein
MRVYFFLQRELNTSVDHAKVYMVIGGSKKGLQMFLINFALEVIDILIVLLRLLVPICLVRVNY